jgi:serine/threonine protein kinase
MDSKHIILTDFGLAKQLESPNYEVDDSTGTLNFLSPERAKSEPFDTSEDMWGLASTMLALSGIQMLEDIYNKPMQIWKVIKHTENIKQIVKDEIKKIVDPKTTKIMNLLCTLLVPRAERPMATKFTATHIRSLSL